MRGISFAATLAAGSLVAVVACGSPEKPVSSGSVVKEPTGITGCISVGVIYGSHTPRSPISDVQVTLHDDDRTWFTGRDGNCFLDSVPAGEHAVLLSHISAAPQALIAVVRPGDTACVGTTMYPPPPKYLCGTVRDKATGNPIPGATVRMEGDSEWEFGPFSASCDSLGKYCVAVESVSLHPPMWFTYFADHPGYLVTFKHEPGVGYDDGEPPDTQWIHFDLIDTCRSAIVGRVTDGMTGLPLYRAYVSASFPPGSDRYPDYSRTDLDGTYG